MYRRVKGKGKTAVSCSVAQSLSIRATHKVSAPQNPTRKNKILCKPCGKEVKNWVERQRKVRDETVRFGFCRLSLSQSCGVNRQTISSA